MLIFDNNLPASLCRVMHEAFHGCVHVSEIGTSTLSDHETRSYARERNLVIVSRDGDFEHLSALHGAPPKVVLLDVGNQSAKSYAEIMLRMAPRIEKFFNDKYDEVLIIRGEATFTVSSNDPSRTRNPDNK